MQFVSDSRVSCHGFPDHSFHCFGYTNWLQHFDWTDCYWSVHIVRHPSPKWPILCRVGRLTLVYHTIVRHIKIAYTSAWQIVFLPLERVVCYVPCHRHLLLRVLYKEILGGQQPIVFNAYRVVWSQLVFNRSFSNLEHLTDIVARVERVILWLITQRQTWWVQSTSTQHSGVMSNFSCICHLLAIASFIVGIKM